MVKAYSGWRGNAPQANWWQERSRLICKALEPFQKATGLAVRLIPVEPLGAVAREHPGAPTTGVCALLMADLEGRKACQAIHERIAERLRKSLAPCQTRCFAGLTDLAAPMVVEGKLVAILEGGQVRSGNHSKRECGALLKRLSRAGIRVNSSRFRSAYARTTIVSEAQLQGAAQLLNLLGNYFADSIGHRLLSGRLAEPLAVVRAKTFAQTHLVEVVKTHDVAQAAHLSLPHFCRVFKTATGMTFTEFLNRCRVQKACQLLSNFSLRITDIAFAVGFQSIPHFDRTFKRYTGQTPKAFRRAL